MKEPYEYHEVDPDGDLVLILGSSAQNADLEGNIDNTAFENPLSEKPARKDIEENLSDRAASAELSRSMDMGEQNGHMSRVSVGSDDGDQEVRIRVSSKHLTLASRVFKSMLQPGFLEGDQLRSQNLAKLLLPGDNPAAMLVLSNLIHGKNRQVPLKVKFSMMTELAILVDKYELLEITEIFLDSWFRNLETNKSLGFSKDLLPWMCISWVFNKEDIFEHVTKLAQFECEGPTEMCGFPIPSSVLSKE